MKERVQAQTLHSFFCREGNFAERAIVKSLSQARCQEKRRMVLPFQTFHEKKGLNLSNFGHICIEKEHSLPPQILEPGCLF
jgi:hypothetical protein